MTPSERARLFAAARGRIVRAQTTHLSGTAAEIAKLLKEAGRAIAAQLAAQPSEYERWSLPQLGAEVRRALAEFGQRGAARASSAIGRSWELGEDLVDAPLEAGGVRVAALLPRIDTRQLQAMRAFVIDRIKDVSLEAGNKISAELGLVVIGARSASDAIKTVSEILGEGSRARAATIVRDNLGRAFSFASNERMVAAADRLPGLNKQWRRSGKRHPRLHHDLADGQIVEVGEPFILKPFGRPAVRIMFPRDPAAPIEESINCGCMSLPIMAHWQVKYPGRTPGSPLLDDSESVADILARQRAKAPA